MDESFSNVQCRERSRELKPTLFSTRRRIQRTKIFRPLGNRRDRRDHAT